MGKYFKTVTTFDEKRLMEDIYDTQLHIEKPIVLVASKETQDYLEKEYNIPNYPDVRVKPPYGICSKFIGYKMLRDDSIEFGEIKIFSEIK